MTKRLTASLPAQLIVVLLLLSAASGGSAGAQNYVERGRLPERVDQILEKSDAVIAGSVVKTTRVDAKGGEPSLSARMAVLSVRVDRVVKGDQNLPAEGGTVPVYLFGASEAKKDAEPGLETLPADGTEVLVALTWWPQRGGYVLSYGADSMFEIRAGVLAPRGKSRLSRALKGERRDQLLEQLSKGGK